MKTPRWRVGTKLGRTLYRDGQCVGMMDSAELAGEIVAAMEALERIKGTTGKWCVHCSRAEGDHTDNCPAGIATRALAAHSASAASAANDGPVVQASPETREMLAAMTARWPAPEPWDACCCGLEEEHSRAVCSMVTDAVVLRQARVVVNREVGQQTLRAIADQLPAIDRDRLNALSGPAPEPVKPPAACLCKDQKEAKCPCVVCGCALKNALRPDSPPSGHGTGRTPAAGTAPKGEK